jgi:HlyD family secretion protein
MVSNPLLNSSQSSSPSFSSSPSADIASPHSQDELLPAMSRWSSLSGMVMLGSLSVVLVLSGFMKYNVTVKANASVRPAGEIRVVQAEMEGTVEQITVEENQTVRQGDPIAYLDDSKLQTQKSQLQSNLQQSQLQLDQLDAQVRSLDTQILAESQSSDRAVSAAQFELMRSQREYGERQAVTQADLEEAIASLELAQDEMARYQSLVDQGVVSQLQYKEKAAAVSTAKARVVRAQAAIHPTGANVDIAQDRIVQEQARGQASIANLRKERESLLQRRLEIQTQLLRDQKELRQVETDLQKSVVRATSNGTILQLSLRNPNQVVRPSDPIAQIAPSGTGLVIKAQVSTQEIGKVKPGQRVQMRLGACPYPDYGILQGKVTHISADTIASQSSTAGAAPQSSAQGNSGKSFEVTIQPDRLTLEQDQKQCSIQSGMEAEASIVSREETFLQFVLRKTRLLTDL